MVVVMIELDISKVLIYEIEIERENHFFIQLVDYWHLPFTCRNYRNVGNLPRNLPLSPNNHFHQKKSPLSSPVSKLEEFSSHPIT